MQQNPRKSGNNCTWVLSAPYTHIPSDLGIEIPVKELRIPTKEYRGLDFFILAWSKVTVKDLGGCLLMSPTVNGAKAWVHWSIQLYSASVSCDCVSVWRNEITHALCLTRVLSFCLFCREMWDWHGKSVSIQVQITGLQLLVTLASVLNLVGLFLGTLGFQDPVYGFSKPAKFKRGSSFSKLQPGPAVEACLFPWVSLQVMGLCKAFHFCRWRRTFPFLYL